MAFIRHRGKTYSVVYKILDENGEEHTTSETFATQKEADKRKKEIEYKQSIGKFEVQKCATLKELIEEYVQIYGHDKWGVSTYSGNVALINNYILPTIGDTKLVSINTHFMEKYYKDLLKMPAVKSTKNPDGTGTITESTVNEIHKVLRSCFRQAVKWDMMEKNPAVDATVPKAKKQEREIWTAEMLMQALEQAKVQYEYYLTQAKKYDQTIQILHDVNKHIKAIEGLYGAEQEKTAGEYATKIRELLKPLIPVQYTENPILNILLTDKESVMREKGISVTIKIDNVNLNFIEPIDITTIFGNLLDNAIEATEKLKGEKYICIKIGSYHKMIVVSIENNCNEVKWRNGFPVSNKGKNGGIGLLNVQSSIKKYDGDLTLKNDGNKFAAELFLNS